MKSKFCKNPLSEKDVVWSRKIKVKLEQLLHQILLWNNKISFVSCLPDIVEIFWKNSLYPTKALRKSFVRSEGLGIGAFSGCQRSLHRTLFEKDLLEACDSEPKEVVVILREKYSMSNKKRTLKIKKIEHSRKWKRKEELLCS